MELEVEERWPEASLHLKRSTNETLSLPAPVCLLFVLVCCSWLLLLSFLEFRFMGFFLCFCAFFLPKWPAKKKVQIGAELCKHVLTTLLSNTPFSDPLLRVTVTGSKIAMAVVKHYSKVPYNSFFPRQNAGPIQGVWQRDKSLLFGGFSLLSSVDLQESRSALGAF